MNKLIAKKYFGSLIDITDPCYDKDISCRMSVPVRAGIYNCMISVSDGSRRINTIGIFLEAEDVVAAARKQIGSIGVDSGLAGFFNNKPDYTREQWLALCDSLGDGNAWTNNEGFFSTTGFGDGYYPVYAYRQNGTIIALEIHFI